MKSFENITFISMFSRVDTCGVIDILKYQFLGNIFRIDILMS